MRGAVFGIDTDNGRDSLLNERHTMTPDEISDLAFKIVDMQKSRRLPVFDSVIQVLTRHFAPPPGSVEVRIAVAVEDGISRSMSQVVGQDGVDLSGLFSDEDSHRSYVMAHIAPVAAVPVVEGTVQL